MAEDATTDTDEESYEPTPWHLKLMLLGLVLYLAYRGFQLVEWLVHEFL